MADTALSADDIFALANNTPEVKLGVKKQAAKIAARTRKELARAGVDASVSIRDHPLSSGRTSVDVVVDAPDGTERIAGRILRRAGREGRGR
ncbi:hypothetical protein [Corynebacterium sp. CNJ-954]|uniref:hypothetical protein n=1 Tax=Corynebacterium sp. CNJ-954 TaxID=1904962 RepID=UPI0011152B17|nr:hypothetical protein [Corynebacterium sp. CNJ-954]